MAKQKAKDKTEQHNALNEMAAIVMVLQDLNPERYPTRKAVWIDVITRLTEIEQEVARDMDVPRYQAVLLPDGTEIEIEIEIEQEVKRGKGKGQR